MANISFNNKDYNIEIPSEAVAALKSHLSTVMNGSGATINLGGTTYNIDSTKLTAATNAFVSHLGTVSGSGYKVKVGGVEYGVDSAKVAGAVAAFEGALGELSSGGGETLGFPIAWNTMEVVGNTSFNFANEYSEAATVKVSDFTPSADELINSQLHVLDLNMAFPCTVDDLGGCVVAHYGDFICLSVADIGYYECYIDEIKCTFACSEAGFYAPDYGSIGEEFNLMIDLVEPPSNDGGSDSGSDKLQNIYWDGNTDGCDVLFDSCFKVSDKAFTREEVIGATLVLTNNGEIQETLLTSENVQQVADGLIVVFGQMGMDSGIMFVSTSAEGNIMGSEIPSKGTYFAKDVNNGYYYISSLTFPA